MQVIMVKQSLRPSQSPTSLLQEDHRCACEYTRIRIRCTEIHITTQPQLHVEAAEIKGQMIMQQRHRAAAVRMKL